MSEAYSDLQIECVECREKFTWEAGEQKFYADRGHTSPKRCKKCREARKARNSQQGQKV